jgi:hypothetical protein
VGEVSKSPMRSTGGDILGGMPIELSREALLAFRNRRWDLVREAKEQFWAQETRARGADAGFAAGEGLWVHARAMDAAWPSDESRCADFEHHLALADKIRRAAHAFTRR